MVCNVSVEIRVRPGALGGLNMEETMNQSTTGMLAAMTLLCLVPTYADDAAARTDDVFRVTTLDPMYPQGTRRARLYFGATADSPVGGMFSFTPCIPAGDARTFSRPAIDLPKPFIKPNLAMQAAVISVPDPDDLKALWHRVVEQVTEHGCCLGVAVALPAAPRAS